MSGGAGQEHRVRKAKPVQRGLGSVFRLQGRPSEIPRAHQGGGGGGGGLSHAQPSLALPVHAPGCEAHAQPSLALPVHAPGA